MDVGEVDADLTDVYRYLSQGSGGWVAYDAVYFECMAEAGFDVPLDVRPDRGDPAAASTRVTADIPFEIVSEDVIAASGYEVTPAEAEGSDDSDDEGPIASDPLSQWIASLSPAEQQRYAEADLGPPGGDEIIVQAESGELRIPAEGCNAIATEARVGDLNEYADTQAAFNDVNISIVASTESADVYVSATTRWVDCMEQRGYSVSDPSTLVGPIDQAIADRACRDQIGLRAAREQARLDAANRLRDALGDLVLAARIGT